MLLNEVFVTDKLSFWRFFVVVSSVGIKRVVCKSIRKENAIVGNEHIHKADNSRCGIKHSILSKL